MWYLLGGRVDIWVSFRTSLGKKLIFVSSCYISHLPAEALFASPSLSSSTPLTKPFCNSQSFTVSHVCCKVVGGGGTPQWTLRVFWFQPCHIHLLFNKSFQQGIRTKVYPVLVYHWKVVKYYLKEKNILGSCLLYHWLLVHDILVLMGKFKVYEQSNQLKINLPQILFPKYLDFLLKGNPNNNVPFSFPEI